MEDPVISLRNFTTKKGAYINQDMISAYNGQFRDGKMLSGTEAKITDIIQENGIVVPIFEKLSGPVFNHIAFDKDDDLIPDPLEERYVFVNESVIPNAGQD